ncbi:MAG: DNA methyltransferase [Candidatus Helarchaeota archaeon]
MPESKVDSRNKLNALSGKEWIISTRSVWLASDYDLDQTIPPMERFLKKSVLFFSKPNQNVYCPHEWKDLKKTCEELNRNYYETGEFEEINLMMMAPGISREMHPKNLVFFRNFSHDFARYRDILKNRGYFLIHVKNFHDSETNCFFPHHLYITQRVIEGGFTLKGQIIWVPDKDSSLQIINEHVLVFRKEEKKERNPYLHLNLEPAIRNAREKAFSAISSYVVSKAPPRDSYKAQHPATFSEDDVLYLLRALLKTPEKSNVLDPFCGVGSTLLACSRFGSTGWGIELTPKWVDLTRKRLEKFQVAHEPFTGLSELNLEELMTRKKKSNTQVLIQGDAGDILPMLSNDFFDLLVTSPPYWKILNKKIDHKTRKERVQKGLETRYTHQDTDETFEKDLANLPRYLDPEDITNPDTFLGRMHGIFKNCHAKLKKGARACVIVSDFRDGSNFYFYHGDIALILQDVGFDFLGLTILHQNNKNLYPYGYPYAFVSNIHHQNILIMEKS